MLKNVGRGTHISFKVMNTRRSRTKIPPNTPPTIGPIMFDFFLPELWSAAPVCVTGIDVGANVDVDAIRVVNVEPSEVTIELDVMTIGEGVLNNHSVDVVDVVVLVGVT